jgi:hypothetical protein
MMDIKTAKLGHTFTPEELADQCHATYGGVAWPGKRPGFAVVLALGRDKQCGKYNIYQLDEYETMHLRKLVRHCRALHFKYGTRWWIGNPNNGSADLFIQEMNAESQSRPERPNEQQRRFYVSSTLIMEMESPYSYLLDTLEDLLDEDCRQLHLKDSRVVNYLHGIEENEIATLELGDYPGIEALAFAAIELREYGVAIDRPRPRPSRRPRSPMA